MSKVSYTSREPMYVLVVAWFAETKIQLAQPTCYDDLRDHVLLWGLGCKEVDIVDNHVEPNQL